MKELFVLLAEYNGQANDQLLAAIEEWYEATEADGVPVLRVAEREFSAVGSAGQRLAVSLSAPRREAAVALVRAALGE